MILAASVADVEHHDRLSAAPDAPGVTLFFIAAEAVRQGFKTTLVELLEDQGHETLFVADLEPRRTTAVAKVPGAAGAAAAVLAIDLLPMKPRAQGRPAWTGFDNPKIPKALERARYLIRSIVVDPFEPLAATHSSAEAWRVVRQLFPAEEAKLRAAAERMRSDFATTGAIRDLTREGRRAKVELIEHEGAPAIRKTYRAAALRYMQREIEVLERLGPVLPELPKLLARDGNHIVISHVGHGKALELEHRGGRPTPLPLHTVRALAAFVTTCVREGFDPIDLRAPGNVMSTDSGLKVIDFELWRRCPAGTAPADSLCLRGVPAGDTERPRGVPALAKSYDAAWYPLTLLPIGSFLHDPPWLQRVKRSANRLRSWAGRGLGRLSGRTNGEPPLSKEEL